jgi:membrane associated rhomboid family serine protease
VSTPTTEVAAERRPAEAFAPMLAMIVVMWVVAVIDVPLDGRLDRFGIRPRRIDGLDGVLFSPFLHHGFGHLIANAVPFVVLGGAICLSGAARFLSVTAIVGVIGGLGTWLTGGTNTLVVGASGLVFGYLLYLITRGIFARNVVYLLGGVVVVAVYGSVLWGVLPRPGISWQGHVFGGLGGVAAASLLHGDRTPEPVTDELARTRRRS